MNKVFRCYTEKRPGFQIEADGIFHELQEYLGIAALTGLRIFNRYDVEGIDEQTYLTAKTTVFSEPQCDICYDEALPPLSAFLLAVEALPGQYDQRADSCAQCIQILTRGDRPLVGAAKVYALEGNLSGSDLEKLKGYLFNPVENREASMEKPETLRQNYPAAQKIQILTGFTGWDKNRLARLSAEYGLAMDLDDLLFLQNYFKNDERRDPTVTELRVVDTYWSDHCRHTTFGTHIDDVEILDERILQAYRLYQGCNREVYGADADSRPVTLMNIATMGMKVLKKRGLLPLLDISEEVNACSVHVNAVIDGENQDWLLMFKNETHNHPTEIEPFGGAATCIGGAIRDPLSGRSYVYQAMRVTGAADPTVPLSETIAGKLPQRKLTTTAAAGYSSYGNQIGLATGLVHEFYHPGYAAKRMEIGAVVGAAPAENVVRYRPTPGDLIILLGGRTGRDGCGGATGSSKTHTASSLETCAAEVQKGNPPEERKIQRLFRNPEVTRLIKRCNDFGAGGVSVAIGELADGVSIDLDQVPKKYDGLDGTELAISESQERMAVVIAPENKDLFMNLAQAENLEATVVAVVTEERRMVMRKDGDIIADLSRDFLDSNGCTKHTDVFVPQLPKYAPPISKGTVIQRLRAEISRLNLCSQQGLVERFDGSIGAASVLMPFGGKTQKTPVQVMAALLPTGGSDTDTCSVMSYGFNPFLSECAPFDGAAAAVVESLSKLVAAGCDFKDAYLSFQEYFEKLRDEPHRWGKPFSSLLGAFSAQMGLGVAAIGGKDSMSGSFMDMDVPPTLVSFAVAPASASRILSPEFKKPGSPVYLFSNPSLFDFDTARNMWTRFHDLCRSGKVLSGWALTLGGVCEGIFNMSLGNQIGFRLSQDFSPDFLFRQEYGAILAECSEPVEGGILVGYTTEEPVLTFYDDSISIDELQKCWESPLESVFPAKKDQSGRVAAVSNTDRTKTAPSVKVARPKAVIPVFPGTNCEYDTARAIEKAGGAAEIIVIKNLSPSALEQSVQAMAAAIKSSQMIILPGGFSGGDEPDGSGKFIASFFRNHQITDAVHDLLNKRDGLILGICNGFQALIKLGLLPYGEIRAMDENYPTLTYNLIGRHQSKYVTTRVASAKSPWLSMCNVGDLHTIPVSHGEGRFVSNEETLNALIENGQIATQYTDLSGRPSMDIQFNPNGSLYAIEGITSPDGRVLGKMAHTERYGEYVAKNIYGNKHQPIFESGVAYFK